MSTSTKMHNVKKMEADQYNEISWLRISDGESSMSIFMPLRQAEMIAAAFAEYENWASSQEGPTFDEALGMKCDADARQEAARALK